MPLKPSGAFIPYNNDEEKIKVCRDSFVVGHNIDDLW